MPKMNLFRCVLCFFIVKAVVSQGPKDTSQNLRVCVVEGRGTYRRAGKFCPILEDPRQNSGIECVLGNDRMDCLQRMSKGTVDFGVFSPEDLIAAQWAELEILVTNDIRHRPGDFERNVVAIVNKNIIPSGTTSLDAILRNTTLCHPGLGGDDSRGLSDTLSQYLESLVTAKSCNSELTLAENRIKAMAEFFNRACKAGPWVPDVKTDRQLKSKYPQLCAACSKRRCDNTDPYWGMTGALNCLLDGSGDVTWVSLKEAKAYFSTIPSANNRFVLLCRDGSTSPINSTDPCVWLRRPWPSVVAKRKSSEAVGKLASSLTNSSVTVDRDWRGALAALLEINQALTDSLRSAQAPLDYLSKATGFREAYSQSGCTPPRHITLCTTSIIEKNKCDWLAEAASVYGVEPPLQCSRLPTKEQCFKAIEKGECDVTVANADWLVKSRREYAVEPILYEATVIIERLNTVAAYVKSDANIKQLSDIRGKKIAIPKFDGFAWHAITNNLISKKEINDCHVNNLADYFGDSCVPGIEKMANISKKTVEKLTKNCYMDGVNMIEGELEALRSLVEGRSDVALLSMSTFKNYNEKQIPETWAKEIEEIIPICPEDNPKYCLLSWSTLGQVYASKNITSMKREEIIYMLKKIDQLFGKNYPFHTAMFSMYGTFNHQPNVLFHNNTSILVTWERLQTIPYNSYLLNLESQLSNYEYQNCYSSAHTLSSFVYMTLLSLVLYFTVR